MIVSSSANIDVKILCSDVVTEMRMFLFSLKSSFLYLCKKKDDKDNEFLFIYDKSTCEYNYAVRPHSPNITIFPHVIMETFKIPDMESFGTFTRKAIHLSHPRIQPVKLELRVPL